MINGRSGAIVERMRSIWSTPNPSTTEPAEPTTKKPKYSFETLYKGGKEFEENLRMLNEEHVRKYNLLLQQSLLSFYSVSFCASL